MTAATRWQGLIKARLKYPLIVFVALMRLWLGSGRSKQIFADCYGTYVNPWCWRLRNLRHIWCLASLLHSESDSPGAQRFSALGPTWVDPLLEVIRAEAASTRLWDSLPDSRYSRPIFGLANH